jgi:hypothetical protein
MIAVAPNTLSGGTRIGANDIVGPLGAGGMGEVYRARRGRAHGAIGDFRYDSMFASQNSERFT